MMQFVYAVVLVLLSAVVAMANSQSDGEIKVAVIGSGVGGSTCTHFLRRLLGTKARIDVFERNDRVGGRAAMIEIAGKEYECGGAVIHSANRYLVDFAKQCGLKHKGKPSRDDIGVYNGKEFVYRDSEWKVLSIIKLLWRYGWSLVRMNSMVSETLKSFVKLYDVQDEGLAFETVEDFLNSTGDPRLYHYTQESSRKMLQDAKVGDQLIDELFVGISRMNYGQDSALTGLTGFVSLAGGQSGSLWAVEGGNYQIPKCLLQQSDASLHLNSHVVSISKVNSNTRQQKYKLIVNGTALDTEYDAVVVAAPLEIRKDFVTCEQCSNWPTQKSLGHFQQTVATFVKGNLSAKRFGLEQEDDVPDCVLTTETPANYFSCVGRHSPTSAKSEDAVYKVFSREPLTDAELDDLFVERKEVKEKIWLAYPHYTPPERFESFRLDSGVFYVNPIERAASAMEMSAISGRNAALLVQKYLMSMGKVQEKVTDAKTEL